MRPLIPVACGVLINSGGDVLIAQRPAGKIAAGKWEFPGGKIEVGETARQALVRELAEELGVQVLEARPLIRVTHDYSDRTVELDTWLIRAWRGEPHACENQGLAWCRPERLHEYQLLAADKPIVNALRLPGDYVFTPPRISEDDLLQGLRWLPHGALLRLRLPGVNNAAYETIARRVIESARLRRIQIMLDRDPQQVTALGAAGWHATAARASLMQAKPLSPDFWFAGSAHTASELNQLKQLSADCAVLGSVHETPSHPEQPGIGWERFMGMAAAASLPVYAIGGVGPDERDQAHKHYAQGTAGISAYWTESSAASDGDASPSAGMA